MTHLNPTQSSERIISLDILRGFAILGILIMNMISFSMVSANYSNPMAEGMLEGSDKIAFVFSQLFANQKFMSLFSILFGAGVVLFSERIEGKGSSAAKRHYLRNFWLLLIGLFHAYIIWPGDILVHYALCSIWVFLFRKKSPKTLFIIAGVFYLVIIVINLFFGMTQPFWPPEQVAELCAGWVPPTEAVIAETAAYRGSWMDSLPYRAGLAAMLETFIFVIHFAWQVTGLMLIGMGLYKSKVLAAGRSKAFYKKMMFWGFGIGLTIGILGLIQNYQHDWSCDYSFFKGSLFNFLGSLPMAIGYVGLIMFLCKSRSVAGLQKWLAPVGRMALTNYLMQSIIATFIFYGYGLGFFGTVGRAEQWLYIIPIWVFQIFFSNWWMSKFRYGPFEWLWRTLTYWKAQPMKKHTT